MDYSSQPALPFIIQGINHGLQEAKGLLKVNEEGLELEFEVEDSFFGLFTSGVQVEQINYRDLEAIRFEKGWFRAQIVLKATSMQVLDKVPGSDHATATLKVKRGNRNMAEKVISHARMLHSEVKLRQLDSED